jgi:hypothetical protein
MRIFRLRRRASAFVCPEGKILKWKQLSRQDRAIYYLADDNDGRNCAMKNQCIQAPQRSVTRHLYDDFLTRMQQRAAPTRCG